MESRGFYNEILTEHNLRPEFKHDLPDADIVLEGVNPSCGDDIWLKLKVDGDVITDGAFVGDGCAISQASADIMQRPNHLCSFITIHDRHHNVHKNDIKFTRFTISEQFNSFLTIPCFCHVGTFFLSGNPLLAARHFLFPF